jgi:hypothetical protein
VLLKNSLPPGDYSAIVKLSIPGVSGAAAKVVSAHPTFSISKQDVQQVFTSAAPQTPPPGTVAAGGSSKPWTLIGAVVAGVLLLLLLLLWLLRRRRTEPTGGTTLAPRSTSAAAADAPPVSSVIERTEPPPAVPPPLPPEPEPQPQAVQAAPAPMAPPVLEAQTRNAACDHFWDVAYDRGQLGEDGVWRFPHRCRNCGLELMASDVADASAQAGRS